jgi:hypothetical protein
MDFGWKFGRDLDHLKGAAKDFKLLKLLILKIASD